MTRMIRSLENVGKILGKFKGRLYSGHNFLGPNFPWYSKKSRRRNYICSLCIPPNSRYCILFSDNTVKIVFPKHTADCLLQFWFSPLSHNKKVCSRFQIFLGAFHSATIVFPKIDTYVLILVSCTVVLIDVQAKPVYQSYNTLRGSDTVLRHKSVA